jgi:4a-hydroxytetrahydrobiopterin dehydratase
MSSFALRKCVPYESGTPPMSRKDAEKYLREAPGWMLSGDYIVKEFKFGTYLDGLEFAYSLGKIAEQEDHHPDILIKWKRVNVTLSTHDIKGLSENDFIIAAKTEELYKKFRA